MPRRTTCWALLSLLPFAAMTPAVGADRLNVLLICIDDLKPNLGCFGDPVAVTPNIDRLADRGVRFDAAYCNQAVCSPSRNSLMTGRRPQSIGVYDLPTHFRLAAPDVVTFSQHFVNQGYHAQGLGKIYHTGHGNKDDRNSWSRNSWRPKAPSYVTAESLDQIRVDKQGKKRGPATEAADVEDAVYGDGQIALEAIQRIEEIARQPDQPFFLAVGFLKPHLPFVAPQKYWDLYNAETLPMPKILSAPEGAPDYARTGSGELFSYSDMADKTEIDSATTRHLIHGYYAATSYTDAQIGKVLDALDQQQLTDKTLVVLWGDHGWHLGDHAMWCKHTNYEQAARIPVIVSVPGCPQGAATNALIETVDLYPTVADLAGIEMPIGLDGITLAAVVRDPKAEGREFVTHVYPRRDRLGRAIRNQRYRMVEWKRPGDAPDSADIELYDYQSDPLETKNLAEQFPDVVASMRKQLARQPEAKPQWKSVKDSSEAKAKQAVRAKAFKKRDSDGDGFLTMDEFLINQPDPSQAPKRFPLFDRDGNGKLTAEEYINAGAS
ncbi:sulfatase-like hydrolase/transferase [Novipirellula artificiosorum]|uniref:Choline-sulfatase n=1 Tax=Novipirellula artificiosorum TaxID=2528016 RepID=A0A5C6DKH2_9BACT|nr:sulfatase-like hydrolase/transferase [Novipirellula artificiosorum]TWU36131.1 Choline-sulfatase [Novipirellula artificiosorum]